MVTALVAGPGAQEFASSLRKAGVEAWCFDPAIPGPRPLLVVIAEDGETGGGDASGPTSLDACADLVPDAPFTEWRSLMFSLWTQR
jgi:hypothetical protein